MQLKIWPFLSSATLDLDYAALLFPPFMKERLSETLVQALGPERTTLVKFLKVADGGTSLNVAYRVMPAERDNEPYRDLSGRTISWREAVVWYGNATLVDADAALARVHKLVQQTYPQLWAGGAPRVTEHFMVEGRKKTSILPRLLVTLVLLLVAGAGSTFYWLRSRQSSIDPLIAACNRGDAQSCTKAGFCYLNGDGVPKDDVNARRYFKRGCKGSGLDAGLCADIVGKRPSSVVAPASAR